MRKKTYIPKIITLDTETYGLDGDIRRIAIYDGKQVHYGYRFSDIVHYLETYYNWGMIPHIYVHNFTFDVRKMPEVFAPENVNWARTCMINGSFARLTCKHYIFHDSWRLLPSSLEKLSRDFGVEHGKMDLWGAVQKAYGNRYKDKVDFFMRCDADDPIYLEYLGYDVISLYEIIQALQELSGLETSDFVNLLSTSSLSRYLFKNGWRGQKFERNGKSDFSVMCKNKMWHKDYVCDKKKTYPEIEKSIREACFGGRTEVFKIYTGVPDENGCTAFHYDVNSEYPYVMAIFEFPVGKPKILDGRRTFMEWMDVHRGLGFLECDIFVPKQHIPPLPSHKGKTAFFCGHLSGTWTYVELEYAVKHCGCVIERYGDAIHFHETYPVYQNFINTIYKLKEDATKEGKEALRAFAKLIQNVSFGYTIMNRDDKTKLVDIGKKSVEEIRQEVGDELVYISEPYGYYEQKADVDAVYIQPQVGAYVTSYARILLLSTMKTVEKLGGEVYYCDTDSIVSSIPFPDEIVDATRLGAWDLEGYVYEGVFLQPKVYAEISMNSKQTLKNTKKFKGVSRQVVDTFQFSNYLNLWKELCEQKKDRIVVEQNRTTLRGFHYLSKNNLNLNTTSTIDKAMNLRNMQKRKMYYQQNRTEPYYFATLESFRQFKFKEQKNHYFQTGSILGGKNIERN